MKRCGERLPPHTSSKTVLAKLPHILTNAIIFSNQNQFFKNSLRKIFEYKTIIIPFRMFFSLLKQKKVISKQIFPLNFSEISHNA